MMNSQGLLSVVISGGAQGLSLGTAFLFVRWLARFIGGRLDQREAHLDGATRELIEELRKELDRLKQRAEESEKRMRQCEEKHADSEAKVKRLEAMMQGYGDAKQMAQQTLALNHRQEREK